MLEYVLQLEAALTKDLQVSQPFCTTLLIVCAPTARDDFLRPAEEQMH